MKCKHCVNYWTDKLGDIPTCHADPNWPAPVSMMILKRRKRI